ncbi:MAG: Fe-S cluster assembly protein SufD [Prevotella sp.]|nr:Fe-S cluster assembly protein SufD [Prevotella sp.]
MNSEQQYIEIFEQCRQLICDHSAPAMNVHRDEAFRRFKANGFPSKKVERYKYTDIAKLMAPNYGLNLNRLDVPVNPYDVFKCDVPNLSTLLYFVVNDGVYKRDESKEEREERLPIASAKLPEGVVIGSLNSLSAPESPLSHLLSDYYNRLAGKDGDAITDLNTMLAQDGLLVYVPRGVVVDRAIQVINILKAPTLLGKTGGNALMVNRRVLIIAEEGAEVTLLFCDHTADDRHFLTTQVIEVFAYDNAHVNLYCLEETHAKNVRLSNAYMDLGRDAKVSHNVITLHNGITRNKLDLHLSGEGASCECLGCAISDKRQHVDNNTLIVHHAQHCTSDELYKYVLDDQATGAFAGRVLVEHGAQKTVSQMTNQNLCASREARMYTQPMLEIYADDVKCAHGSTVGQLNDAALFYMRQRGISEHEARTLLQVAFIIQVIESIALTPLRDRLHYLVDKRFRGELNKCEGCKLCK